MAVFMCFDNSVDKLLEFEKEVIFKLGGLDMGLLECMPAWHRYKVISGYGKLEVTRNRWNKKWTQEEAGSFLERYGMAAAGTGAQTADNLAGDDGHFVAHDYARDVMKDYYKAVTSSTEEQWALYQKLCCSHMSMRGIKDKTFTLL